MLACLLPLPVFLVSTDGRGHHCFWGSTGFPKGGSDTADVPSLLPALKENAMCGVEAAFCCCEADEFEQKAERISDLTMLSCQTKARELPPTAPLP